MKLMINLLLTNILHKFNIELILNFKYFYLLFLPNIEKCTYFLGF